MKSTPMVRLASVEELVLKMFERLKAQEVETMGLKARIAALEASMPKKVDQGRIYDALRQIEESTSPPAPGETPDQWEQRFVEKYGTREQFINERMKVKEG
jgi:hypothetical protein